jgi:hypothetical protein
MKDIALDDLIKEDKENQKHKNRQKAHVHISNNIDSRRSKRKRKIDSKRIGFR